MSPSFPVLEQFTEASLSRLAYSALPDAPIQPEVRRRRVFPRVTSGVRSVLGL